jgi:SAM-dependent methyltransferase
VNAVDPARARSFDAWAGEYDRFRPGYPEELFVTIAGRLELPERPLVVDLGAGTGRASLAMAEMGWRVTAVEPGKPMLDVLRGSAANAGLLISTVQASAEATGLDPASADLVTAAQSFHWFDGERALTEIARVLRPRGGLGLLWNTTPWEARVGPWFSALDDALETRRVDLSTLHRHASGRWRRAFDGEHRFEPLSRQDLENRALLLREDFVAGLASRSYVAVMDRGDRDELLAQVTAMLDRDDAPLEGDRVIVPMGTEVYWTRLREAGGG